jgi:hypothetical protein
MAVVMAAIVPITIVPELLEAAWEHACPGREAAERNEILRKICGPPQWAIALGTSLKDAGHD